ncbi:fimbria/pilus outer membrane usher protein [Pseudomonas sp. LSJ-87]|uniref:fimbria/pilus outer membrane usher protein n=1 Tax=Pseudomonas sp. LSJ-87 TaxID=3079932 RepID=UPI0029419DBE|nr:fimbria/pilus outer membrane usher protein [Pseudomonas sp. LSJ-87]MDV5097790.1 fimbria/pilus outer membrane usher protein [Pseudomonas sp. LSJ-87]
MTCLTRVETPQGSIETITYDDAGHQLLSGAPVLRIPRVKTHTVDPGTNQPALTTTYSYPNDRNFLGFGSGLNWEKDKDNLYRAGSDYFYEVHLSEASEDKELRRSSYRYNRHHLLTLQTTAQYGDVIEDVTEDARKQDWHIQEIETVYHETPDVSFDDQLNNFQLPHTVTERWRLASDSTVLREEITITEYDTEHGNLIYEKQPTLYGGALTSDNYRANALGLGKDFGAAGALSFDVTHARSDLGTALGQVSGNSYAARYGKAFPTRTHLRFAGYRYSTEGFRDFDEAVAQRNNDHHWLGSRRSRLEASVYQQLGRSSSLSFNLSQDDYWQTQRQRRQYQFYFNTHYKGINYSLFASQSLNKTHENDRILGLSLSFPLDFGLGSSVTLDTQHQAGRFSQRASLSGGALDNRLNYQAALANDGQQNKSAELSAGYLTPHANFGAGYFEGNEYRSLSVNASGSALVHGDGLVFSPNFGETNALIHVPDTPGAGMENATAARTNAKGYALAPHLQPYRINRLTLTTDQLEPDVEIDNGTAQAVPRRGAIVQRTFAARRVARLVLTLLNTEGKPLPFGTQVKDTQGKTLAVVGQGGQALVATEATSQVLSVRWGEQPAEQCQLSIKPASMRQQQGFYLQTLTCPATEA